MKTLKIFSISLFFAIVFFISYEGFKVFEANNKTKAIRADVLAKNNIVIESGDIPKEWLEILLKIEDPDFYNHKGIDFSTPGAGMTTLTQAMVKYLYFENFQPGFTKIEQSLIARFVFHPAFTKSEQLTVFFNTAYMGTLKKEAIRGFPNAARVYYKKVFLDLSDDEYLSLVAMLIGPDRYSIAKHPKRNEERVNRIKNVLSGTYIPKDLSDIYYDEST